VRNLKYKSAAKEKRKEAKRKAMGGIPSPKDLGEEMPPWYLPPRYKLFFKAMTENRNQTRISRKPMPDNVKAEFVKHSKEFHAYK
jgi:hypothetical protein